MATRPTKSHEWGTGAIPAGPVYSLAQAQAGWPVGYQPPAQWFNEWQNTVHQWLTYLEGGATSTATSGGTTTLTVDSDNVQVFTGTSNQNVVLPDETTLAVGRTFRILNASTGTLTVKDSSGAALFTILPPTGTKRMSGADVCSTSAGAATGGWYYFGQLPGQTNATNTNDSAAAGNVGELLSSSVVLSSPLSMSSAGGTQTLTSKLLTPGEWDVSASVHFVATGVTGLTSLDIGVNTSAAMPGTDTYQVPTSGAARSRVSWSSGSYLAQHLPRVPQSLSANTTVYLLVTSPGFSGGTVTANGSLIARRVR